MKTTLSGEVAPRQDESDEEPQVTRVALNQDVQDESDEQPVSEYDSESGSKFKFKSIFKLHKY